MPIETPKKEAPEIPPSDLRKILYNIDKTLLLMRSSLNAVSAQLFGMAAAVEFATLAKKLKQTLDRWHVYLPFHEASDVDFKFWYEYFSKIHKSLGSRQRIKSGAPDYEYYPDFPFCIDLIDQLPPETLPFEKPVDERGDEQSHTSIYAPRYSEAELDRDVEEYVGRVNDKLKTLSTLSDEKELVWRTNFNKMVMSSLRRQYAEHLHLLYRSCGRQGVEENILPSARNYFNAVIEQHYMDHCLEMAMETVTFFMNEFIKFFEEKERSDEQLLRLTHRLYHRHAPKSEMEAEREVHRWRTEWPRRKCKDRAIDKREELVSMLRSRYEHLDLNTYIDIDRPSLLTDPEFGRFLWAQRRKLEIADVQTIFQTGFRVQALNKLIDPAAAEADIQATRLDQERRQVFHRLSELVSMADWQSGMKAERVQQAFNRLLLPSEIKDVATKQRIEKSSNIFWELLTKRFTNDNHRSLKHTWLNLVGYFLSRGCLKGGGPALCHYFFPEDSKDGGVDLDYNAISKGAKGTGSKKFNQLIPILDELLELKPLKQEKYPLKP